MLRRCGGTRPRICTCTCSYLEIQSDWTRVKFEPVGPRLPNGGSGRELDRKLECECEIASFLIGIL